MPEDKDDMLSPLKDFSSNKTEVSHDRLRAISARLRNMVAQWGQPDWSSSEFLDGIINMADEIDLVNEGAPDAA